MTDREIIAKFAGLKIMPESRFKSLLKQDRLDEIDGVRLLRTETGGLIDLEKGTGEHWCPDKDITIWHGKGGLLEKIEKKRLWSAFFREWMSQRTSAEDPPFDCEMPYVDEIAWAFRRAEPAQLTAALVATINQEIGEKHPEEVGDGR